MKIAIVNLLYKDMLAWYYSRNDLSTYTWAEHKKMVDQNLFQWAWGWEDALVRQGHEVLTICINDPLVQLKWATENNVSTEYLPDIAYEQIKRFKPDVLWYDFVDLNLLNRIKSTVNSLRLVMSWSGSALGEMEIFKNVDLVLSCAPEIVQFLKQNGVESQHLHHGFNPGILKLLKNEKTKSGFSFIGQIERKNDVHLQREKLLVALVEKHDLHIYTSSYNIGTKEILKNILVQASYILTMPVKNINSISKLLKKSDRFKKILAINKLPLFPFNKLLKRNFYPPLYGTPMYEGLLNSLLVLNVHSDTSPEFASNMRLFETTGVGTCLLSDWKKNIFELFEDDKEIITYKSIEECSEKAGWLINHPEECRKIGLASQQRTLKDHTCEKRAVQLIQIIQKYIK